MELSILQAIGVFSGTLGMNNEANVFRRMNERSG